MMCERVTGREIRVAKKELKALEKMLIHVSGRPFTFDFDSPVKLEVWASQQRRLIKDARARLTWLRFHR